MALGVVAVKKDGNEYYDVKMPASIGFSYYGYFVFRVLILEQIDRRWSELFGQLVSKRLTEEECKELEQFGEKYPGVATFVNHSDCDGEFAPEECDEIYEALKEIKLRDDAEWYKDELPKWLKVFKWAAKNGYTLLYC